ncbi:hypothetical protein ZOSMA_29G01370 [Zostera marina]|uniref:Uncharacterized protein n=1 Tax=Zostera marina TaxID=29655 RepID=A0A0K9PE22_ZOSMR|nr:hypothetical protein ZOSMA_29G01370 [Zostera marina]
MFTHIANLKIRTSRKSNTGLHRSRNRGLTLESYECSNSGRFRRCPFG